MATRFYGLSGSGLDVDQLVKDLMKARRVSYDKIWQQKTQVEWKKKDYNTIYTLAQDFQNSVVSDFRRSTSLLPKKVMSSDESVVTATANANAVNVPHSIVVTQLAEGASLTSTSDVALSGAIGGAPGSLYDITINGKLVSIKDSDTINDVVSNINKAGAGVTANYDVTLQRFFIYSNATGASAKIDFTGSTAAGLDFLTNTLNLNTATVAGKDATFKLDGVDLVKSTNNFTISGVEYMLKSLSAPTTKTTVTVQADIDQTIKNVKAFVEDYNTFIAAVNSELSEDKYRDYLPLTDTQKDDMKDSEIEDWEEKAHSGLLRNDSILSEMLSGLRKDLYTSISGLTGDYQSAADIGITTGTLSGNGSTWRDKGKLYLNEEDLRTALTSDPAIVSKIFNTSGDTFDTKGIADRFYDQMKESLTKLKNEAGTPGSFDSSSFLARQISDYSDRLDTMEDVLKTVEDRYYKQFDAMEVALSQMNQQSSWLFQQFSGN